MPFWNRNRPGGRDPNVPGPDPARQQASIDALEAGELPLEAQDRLVRLQAHEAPWTSTLSTGEFLEARVLGLTPLGQVMGSSTMHPAFNAQWLYGAWQNGDIRPLTRALTEARDRALDRLRLECDALKAHGVVGVRLMVRRPEWGSGLLEFTAMGTAVSLGAVPIPNQAFLGTLSALDTAKLVASGYIPMDLAFSTTAYYVMTTWGAEWSEMSWANQEIPDFSRAIYEARDFVVAGMREGARHAGADGVLGAEWEMDVEEVEVERPAVGSYGMGGGYGLGGGGYGMGMGSSSHRDHIIHLTITGTAVGKLAASSSKPPVLPILSLKDAPEGVKDL